VPPTTSYARAGDLSIAYQVVGEGERDLVVVPGWLSHLEYQWEEPSYARFLERLASFSRLILFDKRGSGLSDRVSTTALPTLEERMDDVRAVMDAVESEHASLLGFTDGGAIATLFAATYPQRADALVLIGSYAVAYADHDTPEAVPSEHHRDALQKIEENWGSGGDLAMLAPSTRGDERFRRWWATFERLAASPGAAIAQYRMTTELDIRHILETVQTPTLVLHRSGDRAVPRDASVQLEEGIPGARRVELEGEDHLPYAGDADALLDEVEEFLTGARARREPDRRLATVLFTDIVGSTSRAAELGDRRWRDLLESHNVLVRRQLERFRGNEVKTMGDGFLATFDGPARGIRCAMAISDAVRGLGLEVRAGLHTGECEFTNGDVGGVAVAIGARVGAMATANEVLVSGTVKDLVVGSGLDFEERGAHALKGVPGEWPLFAVRG
jgi:class 3 adenylate cyclase